MKIFSKSKKEKEHLVLVFDIGSASIGAVFFLKQKKTSPKILHSMREQIRVESEFDQKKFFESTMYTLRKVAGEACLAGFPKPEEVFCILSAPWFDSETRTIQLEKNTPFVFTDKLAESLIQKEVKLFQEEHQNKYGTDMHQIRSLELKTMSVSLNGYKTVNPYNQKAKSLELTIFLSMSQEYVLKEIENSIIRHFNVPVVRFSSFTMASFSVARDMFVNQDNFLLVNIGGEVTEISMVKQEVIKSSVSFPIAENFMVRNLAQDIEVSTLEARSFLSIYCEGHMSDDLLRKIEPTMTKIRNEWLRNFQESLHNLTNDISIPATIFITVNKDLAELFAKTIKTEQLNQYTLTESKFRLLFLSLESLHGIATWADQTERDPFLIIESIYINQFLK